MKDTVTWAVTTRTAMATSRHGSTWCPMRPHQDRHHTTGVFVAIAADRPSRWHHRNPRACR
jgi:hypothetical protein